MTGLLSRLVRGGLPALFSTAIMLFLPLLGRAYLTDDQYAIWALIATVASIGLLVDFGGPLLAVRMSAVGQISGKQLAIICAISGGSSLVVGICAAAVWPVYSQTTGLVSPQHTPAALLAAGVGGMLRSITTVYAGLALGSGDYRRRGTILLSQSVLQVAVTWEMLLIAPPIWALPVGLIASAGAVVIVLLASPRRRIVRKPADDTVHIQLNFTNELRRFVSSRGVATLIGLSLTQLDRWIVGLVCTPAFLANYDLAARFAVMPRTAALTLGLSFVHEATNVSSRSTGQSELDKRLLIITATLVAAGTVGVGVLTAGYLTAFPLKETGQFIMLLGILLVSNGINALTGPGVLILTGLGAPQYELAYLIPAGLTAACGAAISVGYSSQWGVAITVAVSLALWSAVFVAATPRLLRRRIGANMSLTSGVSA